MLRPGLRGSDRQRSPCADAAAGHGGDPAVVMTAPPWRHRWVPLGTRSESEGGLHDCINSVTRIGRRKRLESEYVLGEEIGHNKFESVRVCRAKAGLPQGEEEFTCTTLPRNAEDTVRVHREVETMQHLSGHPGGVTLTVVFEDAESPTLSSYLVMELCHGGRLLDDVAREGRLFERRPASVIRELMAVLKYYHEMGVVHRDIKPDNVLLTKAGRLKFAY